MIATMTRTADMLAEVPLFALLDENERNVLADRIDVVTAKEGDVLFQRGDPDELFRIRPAAALDMLTATGRRLRETTRLLRHSASRNINREEEDKRTRVMKIADWISEFSGSLTFLFIHVVLFFIWIVLNV